ncbi:MAG: class I SAM-dependent methyltransferase [Desulfovibrio sp.]|uniref:class I SAM-dependent methyltransferase n=1 Tax=Desulfovibrio sp. 7SRBS1 TaxID=3378064 RepID=UPI003B4061AC
MIDPAYKEKAAFFDGQANAYWADSDYTPEEHEKIRKLLSLLEAGPGKRILEPGCGTGRLTTVLGQSVGPEGGVTALDISARMVETAQRRCAGQPHVQVLVSGLESCSLPESTFDAVACHQAFPHFNDHVLALEYMSRYLRPAGRLVISHFIGRAAINDVHRKGGTAVEKDLLPDADDMRALLAQAGFIVELLEDTDDAYYLAARLRA